MKPEERDAAARQRTAFNAWFASVVAVFIYLLLPWLISAPRIPQGEPYRGFRVILWLVAMIQTGVLWWWMRRYLGKEAILKAVQGTAINPVVYYMARKIAAIGMAQSLAVYGLVLAFVGGYFWDQYILTTISAALLMANYPSPGFVEELARESEDEPVG
jgi:hypothetical protein